MTDMTNLTDMTTSLQTFSLLAPEIALVLAAIVAFLAGAFAGLRSGWLVALVGIAAAMALAGGQPAADAAAVAAGPVLIDAFSAYIRWMVLVLGALLALVQAGDIFSAAVSRGNSAWRGGTCEEAGTFLLLLAGLSLVGIADDLVLLFAGLELVSIPTYILLALKRTDAHGQEASLKYFFLSLVASSLFLYALTCLYGIGGSTSLATIGARLRSTDDTLVGISTVLLPVALGMAMAGAAFRLAAVPMHFYAPDVYEGTSPGNAALLSTLPKVAGIVVLLRLLGLAVTGPTQAAAVGSGAVAYVTLFWQLAAVLAAITMTVGNVMALLQQNLRRLLACSSIAHAGYLLLGVAAAAAFAAAATDPVGGQGAITVADKAWTGGLGGTTATLFYLATYALATIGVFAAITYLGHRWPEWSSGSGPRPPREEITTVDDLNGLSGTNPVAAFAITVFLLSLAGIPPLPGFWGKLSLATAALEIDWNSPITFGSRRAAFVALAVILVLNAAIAAAYYLRIIAAMYFRSTKRGVQADGGLAAGLAMLACLALVFMATAQPHGLFNAAVQAGTAVRATASTTAQPAVTDNQSQHLLAQPQ
ncbi:MAG: NADH-quinone oxidoreductase subunit N [Planctomycetia bacterium]|jgi:NADH-quinone oxidoreductase subunit N|nr:NADH-quinone oxidoreductase subunit N [Planctomycetia bacterium]